MVAPGDVVRVSFTAPVHRVGVGNQVWVLVNGCWFAPQEYELLTDGDADDAVG